MDIRAKYGRREMGVQKLIKIREYTRVGNHFINISGGRFEDAEDFFSPKHFRGSRSSASASASASAAIIGETKKCHFFFFIEG